MLAEREKKKSDVSIHPPQLYTSLLFAFELVRKRSTLAVSVHAHILLLIAFAVFFGRDVFPLGTFDRVPLDVPETKGFAPVILFWTKIGLLGVASSVVPFVTPRDYVPIDPSVSSNEAVGGSTNRD